MKVQKLIIGILILTSILFTVSCTKEISSPLPETSTVEEAPMAVPAPDGNEPTGLTPPTGRENVYSVQIDLFPSKLVYLPGEEVQMELVLANASQGEVEPVILNQLPPLVTLSRAGVFTGPAVPPGLSLPGTEPVESTPVKGFAEGTDRKTLAKGEEITYSLTWDQKDMEGNLVSPGWYYYETSYHYRPVSSEDGTTSGVRNRAFLIQYPQGAMVKTIEVNQSRTIKGLPLTVNNETKLVDVVITLERVELSEMGATFYATMTSSNNPVSGYSDPEWSGHVPLNSQFVIDGVVKETRAPSGQFLDNGIMFRWGASPDDDNYLDPVPADAKQLTFVIPEIKPDWEGPWEFEIPLE